MSSLLLYCLRLGDPEPPEGHKGAPSEEVILGNIYGLPSPIQQLVSVDAGPIEAFLLHSPRLGGEAERRKPEEGMIINSLVHSTRLTPLVRMRAVT